MPGRIESDENHAQVKIEIVGQTKEPRLGPLSPGDLVLKNAVHEFPEHNSSGAALEWLYQSVRPLVGGQINDLPPVGLLDVGKVPLSYFNAPGGAICAACNREPGALREGRRLEAEAELTQLILLVFALGAETHSFGNRRAIHAGTVVGDSEK